MINDTFIQFFAKAIMPLFTLFILLMLFDLAFHFKNPGFFIAMVIVHLTFKKFLGVNITQGLADIPCAFFGMLALYTLLKIPKKESFEKIGIKVVISSIFIAGAAVTKQVGLLLIGIYPLLIYLFIIKNIEGVEKSKVIRILLISLILILVITLPWYLSRQFLITKGQENSEINMILGATNFAFKDSTPIERTYLGLQKLEKYFYLLLFLIPSAFFVEKRYKWIIFFVIYPLTISWALIASYDFRNLALAMPFFCMASGITIYKVIESAISLLVKINFGKIKIYLFALLLVILSLFLNFWITPEKMISFHQEQVLKGFSPEINHKLIESIQGYSLDTLIITNYPTEFLPGLEGRKVCTSFSDYETFLYLMQKPNVAFILFPRYSNELILGDIETNIHNGNFELLFEDSSWINYMFIHINNNIYLQK